MLISKLFIPKMGIEMSGSKIVFIFAVSAVLLFSYQEAQAGGGFTVHTIISGGGGDCGEIGEWNQGTLTCTLTGNISTDRIVINSDGVTLDGNNNSLFGGRSCVEDVDIGILVVNHSGVTIKNISVFGYDIGIFFDDDTINSTIIDTVSQKNCQHGLILRGHSDNNNFTDSDFSFNDGDNIQLRRSDGNKFVPSLSKSNGNASHTSPAPSPSESNWSEFSVSGQLSCVSGTPSSSLSDTTSITTPLSSHWTSWFTVVPTTSLFTKKVIRYVIILAGSFLPYRIRLIEEIIQKCIITIRVLN